MQIEHDDLGKPCIAFLGFASELASKLGIDQVYLSVADEKDYAVAFVVLEGAG